jgi:hypothetical protein
VGKLSELRVHFAGGVVVSPLKQMVMKVDLDGARTA